MARTKPKPQDIEKSFNFYKGKVDEFMKQSLEELQKYYQGNEKKIGGMHKRALFDVVNTKLQELKEQRIKEEVEKTSKENEELKMNEIKEETKSST